MLRFILTSLLFWFSISAMATSLQDFNGHRVSNKPWNEQWFFYIYDPEVGYFKFSVQTFVLPDADSLKEQAYIHLLHTDKQGRNTIHDYYFDDIRLSYKDDANTLSIVIPDVLSVTDNRIELTLPEVTFSTQWIGPHQHYWSGENPGRSPFGLITELPFVDNKWFVYSLATPATYQYQNNEQSYAGMGSVYIDKGWTTSQGKSFSFVMATTNEHQLMISGGSDHGFPLEMWAAQFRFGESNMVFRPKFNGLSVTREYDSCSGFLTIEFKSLFKKLVVQAEASQESFYDSLMPSIKVFNAPYPSMKSMGAMINVKAYRFGLLIEEHIFPQGILEFGGEMHCDNQT
ncbi:hypothetical protein [Pleionea sp. CnH1-48]|uniref:hypothetical protein n=1 Tax=Pleionea sp. CnH1-48 TaxID=2954494 RepID=UPI002098165B|nr:hypothetical protein [Pleionea sp. CnH1-48]MCO7224139.1 hypothetical protein [Pleionea sp. CnH1-48]